jgi:hypothetical protein
MDTSPEYKSRLLYPEAGRLVDALRNPAWLIMLESEAKNVQALADSFEKTVKAALRISEPKVQTKKVLRRPKITALPKEEVEAILKRFDSLDVAR